MVPIVTTCLGLCAWSDVCAFVDWLTFDLNPSELLSISFNPGTSRLALICGAPKTSGSARVRILGVNSCVLLTDLLVLRACRLLRNFRWLTNSPSRTSSGVLPRLVLKSQPAYLGYFTKLPPTALNLLACCDVTTRVLPP